MKITTDDIDEAVHILNRWHKCGIEEIIVEITGKDVILEAIDHDT